MDDKKRGGSKCDKSLMDDMLRKMGEHAPSSGGKSVVSVRSNTPYFGQDDKGFMQSMLRKMSKPTPCEGTPTEDEVTLKQWSTKEVDKMICKNREQLESWVMTASEGMEVTCFDHDSDEVLVTRTSEGFKMVFYVRDLADEVYNFPSYQAGKVVDYIYWV